MKHYVTIFLIILYLGLCSQSPKQTIFSIDEIAISINGTTISDKNTMDRFGFGFGLYHIGFKEKKINLLLGLEHNYTSQLKKNIYLSHYSSQANVTYNLNYLSIPIVGRLNYGKKVKTFFELGIFGDIPLWANAKGTLRTYLPDDNNQISYTDVQFTEKNKLHLNYGFNSGVGLAFPISSNNTVIFKLDYKFGWNDLNSGQDTFFNRYLRFFVGFSF